MGGGSLTAIVQELVGGVAVVEVNRKSEELNLRIPLSRSERKSHQFEAAPGTSLHHLSKKVATERNHTTDSSAQIYDGRYASTYQLAHCSHRPSSPDLNPKEFPVQRHGPCRIEGNFEVGSYSFCPRGSTRAISPSFRLTTSSRERGCVNTTHSPPERDDAFANSLRKYPSTTSYPSQELFHRFLKRRSKLLDKALRHTKSLRTLTNAKRIKKSSKTLNLNWRNKEQTAAKFWSRKFVTMHTNAKQTGFRSSGYRSPGPCCSRNIRAPEPCGNVNTCIPQPPPETASGDRRAGIRENPRTVYGQMGGPLASYNVCPRMLDRLDKHRRDFHRSEPINNGSSPKSLHRLKVQESSDTYGSGILGKIWLGKNRSRSKLEKEKGLCECKEYMQERQKKQKTENSCECHMGPSSKPFKSLAGISCLRDTTICECDLYKTICECTVPVKEPQPTSDCNCMIEHWLSELPILANEKPKDKATRDNIIKDLVKTISAMDDDKFNKEGSNEIKKHVREMPMWLPKDKERKEKFIDEISNNLFDRYKAFRNEKSRPAGGSILDELSDELANDIFTLPKKGIQPVDVMTDELRNMHEQLVFDVLNEVPEFNNVSENKKKVAAKDLTYKLTDLLVQNSDDEKVEKIDSVMRFLIARNWLALLSSENSINLAPEKQGQVIKNIVKGSKAVQAKFPRQSPDSSSSNQLPISSTLRPNTVFGSLSNTRGAKQQLSDKRPRDQDSRKKSPDGKKVDGVIDEWLNELPTQRANENLQDKATRDNIIKILVKTLVTMDDDEFNREGLNEIKKNVRGMPMWLPKDKDSKETFIDEISHNLFDRTTALRNEKFRSAKGNKIDELYDELANELLISPKKSDQPVGVMTDKVRNKHEELVLDALNQVSEFDNMSENKKRMATKDVIQKLSDSLVVNSDDGKIEKIDNVLRFYTVRNWLDQLLRENSINLAPEKQRLVTKNIVQGTKAVQAKYSGQSPDSRRGSQLDKSSIKKPFVGTDHSTSRFADGQPISQHLRKPSPVGKTGQRGQGFDQSLNSPDLRQHSDGTYSSPRQRKRHDCLHSDKEPGTRNLKKSSQNLSKQSPVAKTRQPGQGFGRSFSGINSHNQVKRGYSDDLKDGTYSSTDLDKSPKRSGMADQSQHTPDVINGNEYPKNYTRVVPPHFPQSPMKPGKPHASQFPQRTRPEQDISLFARNFPTQHQDQVPRQQSLRKRSENPSTQYSSKIKPGSQDPRQYSTEMRPGNLDPNQYPYETRPHNLDLSKYSYYPDAGLYTSETQSSYRDPKLTAGDRNPNQYTSVIRTGTKDPRSYSPEMTPVTQEKRPNSPKIRPVNLDPNQYPPEIRPKNLDPNHYRSETRSGTQEQNTPELIPGNLDPSKYTYHQDASPYTSETQSSYKDPNFFVSNRNTEIERQYSPEIRPDNPHANQYISGIRPDNLDPSQYPSGIRPGDIDPSQHSPEMRFGSQDPRQYSSEIRPDTQKQNQHSPNIRPGNQDPSQHPPGLRRGTQDSSQYSPEMRPGTQEQTQHSPNIRPDNQDPSQYPPGMRRGTQDLNQYSPEMRPGTQEQTQQSPEIRPGNLDPSKHSYYQDAGPYTSETQSSYRDPKLTAGDKNPNQYTSVIRTGTQDPSPCSPEMRPVNQEKRPYFSKIRPGNLDPNQYSSEMRPKNLDPNHYPSELRSGTQERDSPEIRPGNLDPSRHSYYQDAGPYSSETQSSYKDPPDAYPTEMRQSTQKKRQNSPEMRPGNLDPSKYTIENRPDNLGPNHSSFKTRPVIQAKDTPEFRPRNLDSKQYPSDTIPGDQGLRQHSPVKRPSYSDPRQYFSDTPSSLLDPRQYSPAIRSGYQDPRYSPGMHYPTDKRPGSQYPGHGGRTGSPDRQDMKSTSQGHNKKSTLSNKEPSSTNEQFRDKIGTSNLTHGTSDKERISKESEFEMALDDILKNENSTEASILMELLTLLEQVINAGVQSGVFLNKLIKHINELSEKLTNNQSYQSYPHDSRRGATPEDRNMSKTLGGYSTDEQEDPRRNRSLNIAGPRSPMRTEKVNVGAGPSRSLQSPRTRSTSPRRSLDDQKRAVSLSPVAKRASSRDKVENQVDTTSPRERSLSPKKAMDERIVSSNLNGRKMSPSPTRHKHITRSKSSETEQGKPGNNAENVTGKAKNENELVYFKELQNKIRKWIDDLGIDLKGNERNLTNETADEVLDRQRYLHLNPSANISDGEELVDMKYQIFKMLKNKVDLGTIKLIMPHVDTLMGNLKDVPVPSLSHTAGKI